LGPYPRGGGASVCSNGEFQYERCAGINITKHLIQGVEKLLKGGSQLKRGMQWPFPHSFCKYSHRVLALIYFYAPFLHQDGFLCFSSVLSSRVPEWTSRPVVLSVCSGHGAVYTKEAALAVFSSWISRPADLPDVPNVVMPKILSPVNHEVITEQVRTHVSSTCEVGAAAFPRIGLQYLDSVCVLWRHDCSCHFPF
jgi:hypothetical protein